NNPFLADVVELVHNLIAVLSARQRQEQDIDQDDQELIMKLSQMYQQQLEELRKQGQQEGLRTGLERERSAMIESILQVRFGEIDTELIRIINPLMVMSRDEFTPLLLQLSREELLARFLAQ
ncbi:MAG: hypothetical protein ACKPCI_30175, partial [Dolichospermum sp.]